MNHDSETFTAAPDASGAAFLDQSCPGDPATSIAQRPPRSTRTIVFLATGTIQTYAVETAATYVIEVAGGQGGAGAKGAWVSGTFRLQQGDRLKIVAGRRGISAHPQHPFAGCGGDSLVWTDLTGQAQPVKLMLSARGGRNGTADWSSAPPDEGGTPTDGISLNGCEVDPRTTDALVTQWTSGAGASQAHAAADIAQTNRYGYNAGACQANKPAVQEGDGFVSITQVVELMTTGTPRDNVTDKPAPAGAAKKAHSPSSQTSHLRETPRPTLWANLLRQWRPRSGK